MTKIRPNLGRADGCRDHLPRQQGALRVGVGKSAGSSSALRSWWVTSSACAEVPERRARRVQAPLEPPLTLGPVARKTTRRHETSAPAAQAPIWTVSTSRIGLCAEGS